MKKKCMECNKNYDADNIHSKYCPVCVKTINDNNDRIRQEQLDDYNYNCKHRKFGYNYKWY